MGGIFLPNWPDTVATYTIIDNDAPPVVSLNTRRISATGDGGTYYLEASLSGPSGKVINVDIGTRGSATSGLDFYDFPFHFNPGQTSARSPLTIVDDTSYEKGEAAILQLVNAEHATIKPGQVALLSIVDNDSPPIFSFQGNFDTFYRTGGEYYVYVNFNYTEVPYQVVPIILPGTTAVEGRDYVWTKPTIKGSYQSSDYLGLRILAQPPGTPTRVLKLALKVITGGRVDHNNVKTLELVDYPGS